MWTINSPVLWCPWLPTGKGGECPMERRHQRCFRSGTPFRDLIPQYRVTCWQPWRHRQQMVLFEHATYRTSPRKETVKLRSGKRRKVTVGREPRAKSYTYDQKGHKWHADLCCLEGAYTLARLRREMGLLVKVTPLTAGAQDETGRFFGAKPCWENDR